MQFGKLLFGVGQRREDMSVGSIPVTDLHGPTSARSGVADVQEDPLDFA